MERDRNLLFGVFAVQLKKAKPSDIMAAAAAWSADPSKDLPARLTADGAVSEDDCELIARLVDEAVAAHDGDATRTLEKFGGAEQVDATFQGTVVLDPDRTTPLHEPSEHAAEALPSVRELPGRYTERTEHARGGQGRLLLVHDEQLGRDVILKELLAGSGSRRATPSPGGGSSPVGRFLREARITGQLEHPSIIPVHELGCREDGTVYYTMKLVRGQTLGDAIQERQTLRERLALLPHVVDLCQGIAYAHSRGVIHRDLKPSNVMVGEFGETVVLDWGLAKVRGAAPSDSDDLADTLRQMDLDQTPDADRTAPGEVLGTPAYMAPEQARGDVDAIDERTDVYALGTILYQCITGRAPFKVSTLREMIHQVAHAEPVSIEETEPDAPQELVAICRRAMQKEQRDRYASAGELAREIERFQSGAVVEAHQYRFSDHLTRWVGRNRAVVTTALAAAAVLVATTAYGFVRISQERDSAVQAEQDALAERERAEDNFLLVREAVDRLYTQIGESELLKQPGLQPVRERLLRTALEFYEEFLNRRTDDPEIQAELANAYGRVGLISVELGMYDRAREARIKELEVRTGLSESGARQRLQMAETHHALARLDVEVEDSDAARAHVEKAFALIGDIPEGDENGMRVRWLRVQLLGTTAARHNIDRDFEQAAMYHERQLAELDSIAAMGLDVDQADRARASVLTTLAPIYAILEDFDRELEALESTVATLERLAESDPASSEHTLGLAGARTNLAIRQARDGRNAAADELFAEAVRALESLVEANPVVDRYQYALARAHSFRMPVLEKLAKQEAAMEAGERALAIMEVLYTKYPDVGSYKAMGATAYARLRRMQRDQGIDVPLQHADVDLTLPAAQGPIVIRIAAQSVRSFAAELVQYDIDFAQTGGIVIPDLPFLAQIGLQGGDIIRAINDRPMNAISAAIEHLDQLADELTARPKATVTLDVERWKHEHLTIRLSFE